MLIWQKKKEYYKKYKKIITRLQKKKKYYKKYKKIITRYQMGKKIITFDNIQIEKHNFHDRRNAISMYDVNIDSII